MTCHTWVGVLDAEEAENVLMRQCYFQHAPDFLPRKHPLALATAKLGGVNVLVSSLCHCELIVAKADNYKIFSKQTLAFPKWLLKIKQENAVHAGKEEPSDTDNNHSTNSEVHCFFFSCIPILKCISGQQQ